MKIVLDNYNKVEFSFERVLWGSTSKYKINLEVRYVKRVYRTLVGAYLIYNMSIWCSGGEPVGIRWFDVTAPYVLLGGLRAS